MNGLAHQDMELSQVFYHHCRRHTTGRFKKSRTELTLALLQHLNQTGSKKDMISGVVHLVKTYTGFEAVGIRLQEEEEFPYCQTRGFSNEFIEKACYLCERNELGDLVRDTQGRPVLSCLCGRVLCGQMNPVGSSFSEGGSFWTNSMTGLMASNRKTESQSISWNRCLGEGFESMALIPLKAKGAMIGLLQLNDHRSGLLDLNFVQFLEALGACIGIAVYTIRDMAEFKQAEELVLLQKKQLKAMASKMTLLEERWKRKVANELHDRISQSLAISKMKLAILHESVRDPEAREKVDDIKHILKQALNESQSLTSQLSYPALNILGLEKAIEKWLHDDSRGKHGLCTTFISDHQVVPLSKDVQAMLFRGVRESLMNIVKHARSDSVEVTMKRQNRTVVLTVADQGIGFDLNHMQGTGQGFGLMSIQETLEHLGGGLSIHTKPGAGCVIRMVAPLELETAFIEELVE